MKVHGGTIKNGDLVLVKSTKQSTDYNSCGDLAAAEQSTDYKSSLRTINLRRLGGSEQSTDYKYAEAWHR